MEACAWGGGVSPAIGSVSCGGQDKEEASRPGVSIRHRITLLVMVTHPSEWRRYHGGEKMDVLTGWNGKDSGFVNDESTMPPSMSPTEEQTKKKLY